MLDRQFSADIQSRIDQKTKPLGSLGQIEDIAFQLALIQSQNKDTAVTNIKIDKPMAIVFAGDHGIADAGVSIAPSEVTQQMVVNFLNGGAAINCFCRANNIEIKVVDTGILFPVESDHPDYFIQRLGDRTANFAEQPAMTAEQMEKGLELGQRFVETMIDDGADLVMFGEMGIANTSSAAAIVSALSGEPASACVGRGTGISDEQYNKKVSLVAKGVERCQTSEPYKVLTELGGFEIVQMAGAFIGAAKRGVPVLVDGFIVSAAAYAASLIDPSCKDVMIFAHQSHEAGHKLVLSKLDANPILDLGLRLGEGTGAALAVPMLKAAAEFYNTMASFAEAGVTV